jgi:recombinational DNA repair protein RecT
VGYGGLRKLVLRNPEVQDVFAQVVCQNDTYRPAESPVSLPIHRLPEGFTPRGRAIGYYAAAYLRTGFWRVVTMSKAEVMAHRDRYAQGAKSSFWADNHLDKEGLTNFDKMAMKTCLRQLCSPRHLSLDADVSEALTAEEAIYRPVPDAMAPRAVPRPSGNLPIERLTEELYGPPVIMSPTAGKGTPAVLDAQATTHASQVDEQEGEGAPTLWEQEEAAAQEERGDA